MCPCLVLLAVFALFGFGATKAHLDNFIKEVYDVPAVDDSCTCVPFYLCENNTINTDGHGVINIRSGVNAGERRCTGYLERCCKHPRTIDTEISSVNRRTGCGRRNPNGVSFRITGDANNEAQFAEFPWMVAIHYENITEDNAQNDYTYRCGGALIHPSVVLTAAHCVSGKDELYTIRAGEWDTKTTHETYPYQDRSVRKVVTHKDFNPGPLFNDVALLFLRDPVKIAENVDIVCLPPQNMVFDHTRCFATGWGKDVYAKKGVLQVILKKIDLPIVKRVECLQKLRDARLGKHFELDRSFICAGGEIGKDACTGDGGSPLVCPVLGQPDRYVQAGIVAWGLGCGEDQIPGVYVNIPLFRKWIDDQMISHGYDITKYSY